MIISDVEWMHGATDRIICRWGEVHGGQSTVRLHDAYTQWRQKDLSVPFLLFLETTVWAVALALSAFHPPICSLTFVDACCLDASCRAGILLMPL